MTSVLPMSMPATRSANSGSSSTSSTVGSYHENADTVVAVRGSCGQAEIWSAGSKHQFTALKAAPGARLVAGVRPAKDRRRQRTATPILADAAAYRGRTGPHLCPLTAPQARQRTPARDGGPAPLNFHAATASPGHR